MRRIWCHLNRRHPTKPAQPLCHPRGIIAQNLGRPHQQQHRRRLWKIRIQRRNSGIRGSHIAQTKPRQIPQPMRRKDRIRRLVLNQRSPPVRQIRPGRNRNQSPRRRPPPTQNRQKRQRQPAPRTGAAKNDLPRRKCRQKPIPSRKSIVQRSRQRPLRRQPILGRNDPQPRRSRQPPQQFPMRPGRPGHISPAMKIQDHPTRSRHPAGKLHPHHAPPHPRMPRLEQKHGRQRPPRRNVCGCCTPARNGLATRRKTPFKARRRRLIPPAWPQSLPRSGRQYWCHQTAPTPESRWERSH